MEQKCSICGSTQFEKKGDNYICKICGEHFDGIISEEQLHESETVKNKSTEIVTGTDVQGDVFNDENEPILTFYNVEYGYYSAVDGWHSWQPNSANGVSVRFSYRSWSEKAIKYLHIDWVGFNAVNDAIKCQISGRTFARVTCTGPIFVLDNKEGSMIENAWYNNTISRVIIFAVEIEYMDGTKVLYKSTEPNFDKKFIDSFSYRGYEPFLEKYNNLYRISRGDTCFKAETVCLIDKKWIKKVYKYSSIKSVYAINYRLTDKDEPFSSFMIFSLANDEKFHTYIYDQDAKALIEEIKKHNPSVQIDGRTETIKHPSSVSGCYVATCVYGSYDCPQVWTLRRYRDYKLAKTWFGRAFIHIYYAISPTLVRWFGKTKWFKRLWKGKLDKMVSKLRKQGFEDTPYEDKNW